MANTRGGGPKYTETVARINFAEVGIVSGQQLVANPIIDCTLTA
jgi:hypothetical protein